MSYIDITHEIIDMGPPKDRSRPRFLANEEEEFDAFAVAFPGSPPFNQVPPRDPLAVWWSVQAFMSRPTFRRETVCNTCHRWERKPTTVNSRRPRGTMSKDACAGCCLSYLNDPRENIHLIRDRLYASWAEEMERLSVIEADAKNQFSPSEKQRWKRRHGKAKYAVSEAEKACNLAGFSPQKRKRGFVRLQIVDEAAWLRIVPRKVAEERNSPLIGVSRKPL